MARGSCHKRRALLKELRRAVCGGSGAGGGDCKLACRTCLGWHPEMLERDVVSAMLHKDDAIMRVQFNRPKISERGGIGIERIDETAAAEGLRVAFESSTRLRAGLRFAPAYRSSQAPRFDRTRVRVRGRGATQCPRAGTRVPEFYSWTVGPPPFNKR